MKIQEFLQGSNGHYSLGRLLPFMSWFVASGMVIYLHTEEALVIYLTAFVGHGLGSKLLDRKTRLKSPDKEE